MSTKLKAQSEEMVLTPAGKLPISRVHRIPQGGRVAHVGNEIHLIDANNNIIFRTVVPGISDSNSKSRNAEETGSTTYAYWTHDGSPPIDTFLTTWTVPSDPTTDNGQTVFLFNSIKPASDPAIIKPVLQWGKSAAGGGSYWGVASWYFIGKDKLGFVSDLTEVSVGDTLEGIIKLISYNGTKFNYKSSFAGIGSSLITVTGVRELVYATETLEAYAITQSSDYPAGSTPFTGINLFLTDSSFPSLSWSIVDDIDNGLTTTVEVDGSQDGELTIHYPN
jgi:hypothetical protein